MHKITPKFTEADKIDQFVSGLIAINPDGIKLKRSRGRGKGGKQFYLISFIDCPHLKMNAKRFSAASVQEAILKAEKLISKVN